MTIIRGPDFCLFCKHRHPADPFPPTCNAFPNGIPIEIRRALFDHRNSHRGDKGIRFEMITFDDPLPEFLSNLTPQQFADEILDVQHEMIKCLHQKGWCGEGFSFITWIIG